MAANVNQLHQEQLTLGDRIADGVTAFVGSWTFVIVQTSIMALWVAYNTYVITQFALFHAFDPFPFVFLNLFMSAEAAYSTPFIMMSQNRQAAHDRLSAEEDFAVNVKAEQEVSQLRELTEAVHNLTKEIHEHLVGGR